MSSTRPKGSPISIGDRHDEIRDDPNPSQFISCRRRASCCYDGNAVASPRFGPVGGRPSSWGGTPQRQWLLSLQDRRLPGDRDLGWLWAASDLANLRYE